MWRPSRPKPLALDDVRFLRRLTDRSIKVTLPGPYLLTRAMFVLEVTRCSYATKEELSEDVVRILREELLALAEEGVDFVQLDEPVLSELAFAPANTRTFMCAALAARKDPAEKLEFAVTLVNRVIAGVADIRTGLHVCRGNWSRDETTLLRGGYQPLAPYLQRLDVTQLVLEYATERAGDLLPFPGDPLQPRF
jgi:5-methyltetrahydropteroyltriglutamate--homocysteine methyltransferase